MSFWVNLTRVRDTKIPSKTLFLSLCLWSCLWKRLAFVSVLDWSLYVTVEGRAEPQGQERANSSLYLSWEIYLFLPLGYQCSWFLCFSNLDQDSHCQTTTSLPPIVMSLTWARVYSSASIFSLQICGWQSMGLPVSIVTLANSYNKSPFLSFYLSIHPTIHPSIHPVSSYISLENLTNAGVTDF